ncbi:MAG: alpha/beta hydrolase [Deltaproteobacteria bacterium]|nr:alpha/beta hydrolase [Deltaproteobacteria bacterium]
MNTVAVPIVKGEIEFDRFVIPYRMCGAGERTVVFVNGLQQSMAMWHSFVRRFSRNYRIMIFDFPNHGKGRITSGSDDVSVDEQVNILDAVANVAETTSQLTVCSASWGGVVAAIYAVRNPGKVQRLILASMGTRANAKMVAMISKGFGIRLQDRLQIAETLIKTFGDDLPPSMKRKIYMQFQHMSQAGLEAFQRHGLFVLTMRELANAVDVREIKCKTIIVHGQKDTIVDEEDAVFLASQIPNADFKSIPGVGHFLHLEDDEILDIYDDILASPY